jgi:hypothetical protein
MKQDLITDLETFRDCLWALKKDLVSSHSDSVSKKSLREAADQIATMWVEVLRSPLEHRFNLDKKLIQQTAAEMKHLHVLSRPNNLKASYLKLISRVLRKFDDRFILPIKQTSTHIEKVLDLTKIIPTLADPVESDYLEEAIACAAAGHMRAAIVMGWCCAIDRMQRKIMSVGLSRFNDASKELRNRTSGKFKRWNKEFSISSLSELQTVFDADLIVVLEGMDLLDGNQAQRLETCYQYRNHSGHPGEAPIGEPHVVAFFTDINEIILQNPKFAV